MSIKVRINPLKTAETAAAQRSAELARWELDQIGVCPVCAQEGQVGRRMEIALAEKIPVFVCVEHCVALPMPDEMGAAIVGAV